MQLSHRERQVVNQVIKGHSNDEIAEALDITTKTVKFHLTNIYRAENVKTRAQLIVKYLTGPSTRQGLR